MKSMVTTKTIYIIGVIFIALSLIIGLTYARENIIEPNKLIANIVNIDEEFFGEVAFNSGNYDLKPILDKTVELNTENVIKVGFKVGGAKENNITNIIYDIALTGLELDCNLLSPYFKWKLLKNGELLTEGSLDYKFDSIKNGRLVLTPIQQDLPDYSETKDTYDNYIFYMWISDSCQEEDIAGCINQEPQNNMAGKKIKGQIDIELNVGEKKELIRETNDNIDYTTCNKEAEVLEDGDR